MLVLALFSSPRSTLLCFIIILAGGLMGCSSNQERDVREGPWADLFVERQAALESLPGFAETPPGDHSWAEYAANTFTDLLVDDLSWFVEPSTGITGYRPYVKGTDQWGGASRTREITELMAMMDVLWPMYRYLQLHPDAERQDTIEKFIGELPRYYNPNVEQSTNRPGETRHDSWYFMENSVLKSGHLYLISGYQDLESPYFGSLTSAIEMARNFNYLFPQFVNLQKEPADGYNTQNYSTAGLLAYSLIHAYQLTDEPEYLLEAERALLAMHDHERPLELLYEPQELSAAAAAAARLIQYADLIESHSNFAQLAEDFYYAQSQMIYHDEGQIDLLGFTPQYSPWLPDDWRDGLHVPYYNPAEQGGINAPAFKENVEAIIFWADYLRFMRDVPWFDPTDALKVMNLNRMKNYYFFSPNIPDEWERDYGPDSLQFIPYEDIDYYDKRDHEDGDVLLKAGYNGKQIYGAGEVLWSYLMFETLGESDDPNALIVNLNLFDREYPPAPEDRVYLVFNPYGEERTLSFQLKHLANPYRLYADGSRLGKYQPDEAFTIELPAHGASYITLVPD